MAFNHYAKIKRILTEYPGWYVMRINEPTSALSFKGERREFPHYYRAYTSNGKPIKYCKFQQLDLFAKTMGIEVEAIPIVEDGAV
ncbi:MAG: hypothetical protein ACOH18_04575 [Candidatus Saccharimonadaceae bacterium]